MDCREEILSLIRSDEVREYCRETRMPGTSEISEFIKVLHFAPVDIHKKLELLRQYRRELSDGCGDLSELDEAVAMYQLAVKNILETAPEDWFCLKPYSVDKDCSGSGLIFLTFNSAMNYVKNNAKGCYTIEKYSSSNDCDENEKPERIIEYVVFSTGEITCFRYGDYKLFSTFFCPLRCGEIVEIDASPYAPLRKCVLLSHEKYTYVTREGTLKITDMSLHNHIEWYRMKRYHGELSCDEQMLSKISKYLIEREKKINVKIEKKINNDPQTEIVTDEYGTVFSKDMTKLIKGSRIPKRYTIPKTVKEICKYAYDFPEAFDMEEIIIPEGVEVIGDFAFYLSPYEIELPESITTLGCSCFCRRFHIGKNVSEIAEGVSEYGDPISVDPENKYFTVCNDALYSKDMTRLLHVFTHKKIYKVPKSVKKIDEIAFWGNDTIKKIYLPTTVEYFGDSFLPETDEVEIIFED